MLEICLHPLEKNLFTEKGQPPPWQHERSAGRYRAQAKCRLGRLDPSVERCLVLPA